MPIGGTVKDVRPDPILTGLAVELGNGGGYVADIIAPVANVAADTFKYTTWARDDIKSDVRTKRAPGVGANEVVMSQTFTEGSTEDRGLKARIPDNIRKNDPNPGSVERRRVKVLTGKIKLEVENNVATMVKTASNTRSAPSVKWDAANATIRADILAAKNVFRRQCGFNPTHLVLPPDVSAVVFNNSAILELVKYTYADLLAKGIVPRIENMNIIVPGAIQDTSNPGASQVIADIYNSDEAYYLYVDPSAGDDLETMTALRQVRSQTSVSTPFAAYQWREPDVSAHADWVAVDCNQKELVLSQALMLRQLDVLT